MSKCIQIIIYHMKLCIKLNLIKNDILGDFWSFNDNIYMRIFYSHYATYGLDDYEIANIRPKNKNYTIKNHARNKT